MKLRGELSDGELLDLLKSGDHAAFTLIYNRYWDKLYAVAYNRLADEHEAEEAVQNIFLDLWKRKETLELTHRLATYLSVAIKYHVFTRLAQLRREKLRTEQLKIGAVEGVETTAEWLSERELKKRLGECVNNLPEKCRIVFLLSREQHLSNKQIGEELGISEKTVEGHITKALTTLKGSLSLSLPMLLAIIESKFQK
jgi:RNA polymerase sigma-70 factor (ECF subfamily)